MAELAAIDEYFDSTRNGCAIHPNAQACAASLLDRHCHNFTGIQFDPRRDASEPWWDRDRIGSNDLYAVEALVGAVVPEPVGRPRQSA